MKRPNGPPIHIDDSIAGAAAKSPHVQGYLRRQESRKAQPEPAKFTSPRGGGPPLPLPPLEAPAAKGHTIAAQGRAAQAAEQAPPFPPMPVQQQAPPAPPPSGVGGIQQGDMLPQQALQDPLYKPHPGPPFASANPRLAEKYGVVRGGQHLPPSALGLRARALSPDTVKDLQGFVQAQQQAESPETAADYAATPPVSGGPPKEDRSAAAREAFDRLDSLDVGMFRDMVMHDLLNSDEQRRIVESRLQPLDLGAYLMDGYVRQNVPVVPGKYEVEFRSLSFEEEYAIKRCVWRYHRENNAGLPEAMLSDLYVVMTNVAALWSFNHDLEDTHLDEYGRFDEELFWAKFNRFFQKGFHLMASISVQYHWFDARVKRLFLAENIKNG